MAGWANGSLVELFADKAEREQTEEVASGAAKGGDPFF